MGILKQATGLEVKDEMILVRVVQIMMAQLSPDSIVFNQDFIQSALYASLNLFPSTSSIVVNTASAALTQLFSSVFSAWKEKREDSEEIRTIGLNLLSGLISHLSNSQDSEWPLEKNSFSVLEALNLVILVFNEGGEELGSDEVFQLCLEKLLDDLTSYLDSGYQNCVRVVKCLTLYVLHLRRGLNRLVRWCIEPTEV